MQKLDENKAVAVGDNWGKPFEQLNRLNSDSDPDASISGHAVGVSLHGDTVTYSPTLNNFLPKIQRRNDTALRSAHRFVSSINH